MKYRSFLIASVLLLSGLLHAQEPFRDSAFTAIDEAYNSGQYLSAELDARRLLELPGVSTSQRVWLEGRIAFSLIAQGKGTAAKERFISLLRLDEAYELDPVMTSPKILSVFNDARTLFAQRRRAEIQDSLRMRAKQQEEDDRTVTYRTVVFPGWEQLYHGRQLTGTVLMGAGAATLTSGIIFEFLRSKARNEYLQAVDPSVISSRYDRYDSYRKAEIYSFSAFAVVYLLSESEVFLGQGFSVAPTVTQQGAVGMRFSADF